MKRSIYQLLAFRTFSEFANNVYLIIMPLIVLEITGSLARVSFFFAIIKIPSVLLLPFLGVFVERVSRKRLLILCNSFSLLLFSFQLYLFASENIQLVLLAVMGILLNIVFALSDIGTRMIFTELAPTDELEKYNGTKSIMDNIAAFLAPMLGTFLYGIIGVSFVFLLIVVLYGGALLGSCILSYTPVTIAEKRTTRVLKEIGEGLQFVKRQKSILAFFILVSALNFFVASTEEVTNPGIILSKYHITKGYFGFSSTFFIAGVILSSWFIVRNRKIDYQKNLPKFFVLNSLIMILIGGVSVLFYGHSKAIFYGIFLVLEVLLGFVTILVNVPLNAYFQAHVPLEYQGRFFSLLTFAAHLTVPFGITYTGMLSEKIGPDVAYILNNLCVIAIVLVTYRNVDILKAKAEREC